MTLALETSELVSGYGTTRVIDALSLSLAHGEILAVVGKNGMGKTSLLKAIMGFLPAWQGRIRFQGRDVTSQPPNAKRRQGIVHAPQERALFQDLTIRDNLRLGLLSDKDMPAALEQIGQWFPVLTQRLHQRAGTLSGGEQKMLIVGRALMAKPAVLLLDEVSEGLQPSIVDRLAEVLANARRSQGTAMVVVEQHLTFALGLADRYMVIKRGAVVMQAPVAAGVKEQILGYMAV